VHSKKEIFKRADEMKHHPLRWPKDHWFTQSTSEQLQLWEEYRIYNPMLILSPSRHGW
jgi:hypothetical protein